MAKLTDELVVKMGERVGQLIEAHIRPLETEVERLREELATLKAKAFSGVRRRFVSVEPDPADTSRQRAYLDDGSFVSVARDDPVWQRPAGHA